MIKNLDLWLGEYLKGEARKMFTRASFSGPRHVMFCFVDHYEPDWNQAPWQTQQARVDRWLARYPKLVADHRDADGHFHKHSFFYPAEVYCSEHLAKLASLCKEGYGEVEIHIHLYNDNAETFRAKMERALKDFSQDGFLGKDKKSGQRRFGFIHGNWALNNSHPNSYFGGINQQTTILRQLGCYADFTLPSAPSRTQSKKINSIYYDSENSPHQPRSHDRGVDVAVKQEPQDALMIIQGPLTLNWHRRKWGILPRIENSDIVHGNTLSPDRVDLWIREAIGVQGRPEWIFVKVHTHGAIEKNAALILGPKFSEMLSYLESKYNDQENYVLHYVSAREMYNIIKAAEAGEKGNPNEYRDYVILPPGN